VDLFSPKHLLIVLLVVLVVFGTKKLRTIGSDLGQAVRGFKESNARVCFAYAAGTGPDRKWPDDLGRLLLI